ncbi:hypothetical protein [Microbacterium sp. 77mftsu3.1]|uniref:hypothetical protein n=1 Tax=Microbacterium sp. 77mftsu3.1 TaxID=1761802 RepID=UPI000370BA79|nr:hypothetical protein [Microbacterium sp. 77mftsu3.1]SDH40582.1 hypothetical protein SAMN04488590_3258 [Microbacterium sp. 77mftsu3.1]
MTAISATTGFGRADEADLRHLRELAAENGEWRDPQRPTVLVIPYTPGEAYVLDEETGNFGEWAEDDAHAEAHMGHLAASISRYFTESDPLFVRSRDAIWSSLEDRLEDDIHLDLNNPEQSARFAALVNDATRAVLAVVRST